MSRSGYSDDGDIDNWQLIKWRGAVASAIRGRRGQAFLREMLAALDAIPTRTLITHDLETLEGVCALGAVGRARRLEMPDIHEYDWDYERDGVAALFGVAPAMIAEIMYENDLSCYYWGSANATPEQRWDRMRCWVESQIKPSDA